MLLCDSNNCIEAFSNICSLVPHLSLTSEMFILATRLLYEMISSSETINWVKSVNSMGINEL
jgi:hypothetical protein